jgi:hypothetical protein
MIIGIYAKVFEFWKKITLFYTILILNKLYFKFNIVYILFYFKFLETWKTNY